MRNTLLLCLALFLSSNVNAQKKEFYTERWSDVYKNEFKDLPQSALMIVDTIYYQAKMDKNITEITKSLLYQSKFAMILKEKAEIVVVQKFKKEIEASHAPLRNILESMLAEIYWQYFQENRWKYYNRSEVSEMPTDSDFTAWDAAAMLREIDKHYQASLLDANILQDTPLEKFDDILALGHRSKQYRPTLYDFLLNNALDFYSTNEDGLQNPGDKSITLHDYYGPIDNIHFDENSKLST